MTGERIWHVAGACLVCAAGLGARIVIGIGHPVIMMIALTTFTNLLGGDLRIAALSAQRRDR